MKSEVGVEARKWEVGSADPTGGRESTNHLDPADPARHKGAHEADLSESAGPERLPGTRAVAAGADRGRPAPGRAADPREDVAGAVKPDPAAAGGRLLATWRRVGSWPAGGRIYGWLVGRMARYSGSIAPVVLELEPGRARVLMRDRPRLRNHVGSLHAIALMNLGELTTGLALMTALPNGVRGIPTALSIEFVRKARGPIEAECVCAPPQVHAETDYRVAGALRNADGAIVARVVATWKLSRTSKSEG